MFIVRNFELTEHEYGIIKIWSEVHDCSCRKSLGREGQISVTFIPTVTDREVTVQCECGKQVRLNEM